MAGSARGPAQDLPVHVRPQRERLDPEVHTPGGLHPHRGPGRQRPHLGQGGEGDGAIGDADPEGAGSAAQGGREALEHRRLEEHEELGVVASSYSLPQQDVFEEVALSNRT